MICDTGALARQYRQRGTRQLRGYAQSKRVGECCSFVVKLKTVSTLGCIHTMRRINYFRARGMRLGLLFNFGMPRVEIHCAADGV